MRAVVRKAERIYGDDVLGFIDGWQGVIDGTVRSLDVEALRGTLPAGRHDHRIVAHQPLQHRGWRRRRAGIDRPARGRRAHRHRWRRHAGGGRRPLRPRACPSSVCPRPSTTTSAPPSSPSASTRRCRSRPTPSTGCTPRPSPHHRVIVVEVMGRHAGHIAMWSGIAGGATVILIPEEPYDIDAVCAALTQRRRLGRFASIVVVAEGATPGRWPEDVAVGATPTTSATCAWAGSVSRSPTRSSSGPGSRPAPRSWATCSAAVHPPPIDRMLATRFGIAAIDAVHDGAVRHHDGVAQRSDRPRPLAEASAPPSWSIPRSTTAWPRCSSRDERGTEPLVAPGWFTPRPGRSLQRRAPSRRRGRHPPSRAGAEPGRRGLVFVHGGGAHAHWWTHVAASFAVGVPCPGRRPVGSRRQPAPAGVLTSSSGPTRSWRWPRPGPSTVRRS